MRVSILGLTFAASIAASAISGSASAQNGFAWACEPTTASYNAAAVCSPYAYNSRGGAVNITRSSVGNYSVTFVGLGGRGQFGGTVQVTAYGVPNASCYVDDWNASANAGGDDFIAYVTCFSPNGVNTDHRYDILVEWLGE